jgi:hypothetical protein
VPRARCTPTTGWTILRQTYADLTWSRSTFRRWNVRLRKPECEFRPFMGMATEGVPGTTPLYTFAWLAWGAPRPGDITHCIHWSRRKILTRTTGRSGGIRSGMLIPGEQFYREFHDVVRPLSTHCSEYGRINGEMSCTSQQRSQELRPASPARRMAGHPSLAVRRLFPG